MTIGIFDSLAQIHSNGIFRSSDTRLSTLGNYPHRSDPQDSVTRFATWLKGEDSPKFTAICKQSIRLVSFFFQQQLVYRFYKASMQSLSTLQSPLFFSKIAYGAALGLFVSGAACFLWITHNESLSETDYEEVSSNYEFISAVAYVAATVSTLALAALTTISGFWIIAGYCAFETAYQFQLIPLDEMGFVAAIHDISSVAFCIWRGNLISIILSVGLLSIKYLSQGRDSQVAES